MEEIKLTTKTTKKSLISTVNELAKAYDEKEVVYFICSFLPSYSDLSNEDRGTKIKYIEDVINNHFTVKTVNDDNLQIVNAINFSIKHFNEIEPKQEVKKTTRTRTKKSSK